MTLLLWALLGFAIVFGLLCIIVLDDVLRYRDLQRRLIAEREKREDPHEEG